MAMQEPFYIAIMMIGLDIKGLKKKPVIITGEGKKEVKDEI